MKKTAFLLLIAVISLLAAAFAPFFHMPDANRIHIYSQGDSKWDAVAYGPEGSGKTLLRQGCGVFTLAHASQWLGLEDKDDGEQLPVRYAGIFTPETAGYYTNQGMDVCTLYYGSELYADRGASSGWSADEAPVLRDVLRKGGVSVLHIKSPTTGHWALAVALSPAETKVLVIDSCLYVMADTQTPAYTFNPETLSFERIQNWTEVSRSGDLRGGGAYWIDYADAARMHAGSSYILTNLDR